MFTLPTIRASFLGNDTIEGEPGGPDTEVLPYMCVLPMGFNWAVHLCQSAVSHQVKVACSLPAICDRQPGLVLASQEAAVSATYVDKFAVISGSQETAVFHLDKIQRQLNHIGFPVHEITAASQSQDVMGLRFNRGRAIKRAMAAGDKDQPEARASALGKASANISMSSGAPAVMRMQRSSGATDGMRKNTPSPTISASTRRA